MFLIGKGMPQILRNTLPPVGFAADLSNTDRSMLAAEGDFLEFQARDVILRIGDMHSFLFLVLEGDLAVTVPAQGSQRIISHIRPGHTFGEINLLDPHGASANVLAESHVICWRIERQRLFDFLTTKPDIGRLVMTTLALQLARRVRALTEHVQHVAFI